MLVGTDRLFVKSSFVYLDWPHLPIRKALLSYRDQVINMPFRTRVVRQMSQRISEPVSLLAPFPQGHINSFGKGRLPV